MVKKQAKKNRQEKENSLTAENSTDTNSVDHDSVATEEPQATNANGVDHDSIATENQEAMLKILQQENATLSQSATESLDQVKRAQAELDNVRKRTQRDIEKAHKYGTEQFVKELLPVLDSLELGIDALKNTDDIKSSLEGMAMTMKMFSTALEKSGVEKIAPNAGDIFDTNWHEAMMMGTEKAIKSGAVINTLQNGYQLNGRLIRTAKVIVAE